VINYHKELVNALNTILPTHYEMVLHSGLATPCISYMELNNTATDTGDTVGYSRIQYQVKVWGNDIAVLQAYAVEIDRKLRKLGFKRVSSGELYDNNSTMIQKILTYEALALEEFN
jgi:predicted transcriptional regulator YheO